MKKINVYLLIATAFAVNLCQAIAEEPQHEPVALNVQGRAMETLAGSELGTAAKVDPKRIEEVKEVKSAKKDESHIFILMKTDRNGAIDYQAGYGWEKAGEIKTSKDWKNYLGE